MKTLGSIKLAAFRQTAHDRFPENASTPPQAVPMEAVAHRLGVHKTMIGLMESGRRRPGLELALKMQDLGIADPADWHRVAPANDPMHGSGVPVCSRSVLHDAGVRG